MDISLLFFRLRDGQRLNNNAVGGVAIWINDGYPAEVIEELSIFEPGVFESKST